ncbi:mechanosensitive ion channel [Lonepinella koalarum]|uniref:Small-conductance mechanosensitive channel n=1 Tax=Lonepinella koalarum TaxID=53417 RepID=A0A4R1KSW4_9PAST|nr:mechanosensitive ion channel domain-containing protein [Lonepinella koalarum]MDH2927162.1 mechanosensitive ion channel protein MscS [Lonepinella koalarum]TCK68168.1 small conductance mechanosensitive channel [Lonepinella koalarum]TFJ89440.1 mechanosensitive ion channel [Lonepinella koalarum]TYG33524.1 mechanosensitive ion channel [Lonepinella koalarum]
MSENTENVQLDIVGQTGQIVESFINMDIKQILNEWVIPYGTKILLAILIFWIGKHISRFVSNILGKAVLASSKDDMLKSFVSSISYFLLLLITVIAALSQLGINTSSLVALIGAAGLAIGLSLQNSLQNFAAGVMLLIFKPFKTGDFIEAGGKSGTVKQMGLLMLELKTGDNKGVLVPNGKVFSDSIVNYSLNHTRRVEWDFDISYESNLKQAKEIVDSLLAKHELILKNPAATVVVGALEASSVQLKTRCWVKTSDYWTVYWDMLEQVKLAFDEAGVSIPYDQMDLHIVSNASNQQD